MNVVVVGAGGATGRLVVTEALRSGHSVTALMHTESEQPDGARVIVGDAADEQVAATALAGQDAVIDTVGGALPWKDEGLETSVAHAIVGAMGTNKVRRLIAISAMGVGESKANAPFWWEYILMPTVYRGVMPDKAGMEREFSSRDIDYVLVRPALLTNEDLAKPIRVVEGDDKVWKTARRDLARFMVDQLESDEYVGRSIVVANA